jgi:branched-chain amino acid transport system substrate-binding protein
VASAVALGLTLAACSSNNSGSPGGTSGSGGSTSPIRMVAIVPLSGPAGVYGQQITTPMKLAVAAINAQGGILGRKVVLDVYNTATDPSQAVSDFQEAVQGGTINFLVPGLIGSEVAGVLPLANRDDIVAWGTDNTPSWGSTSNFPYYFSSSAGGDASMQSLINYVAAKKPASVGLLFGSDTLGQAEEGVAKSDLQSAGIKIADTESVPLTATDVTPELERLKNSGAQAVIYDVLGSPSFLILQAFHSLDWNVPVYGGIAQSTLPLEGQVSQSVLNSSAGVVYCVEVQGCPDSATQAKVNTFLKKIEAAGVAKADPWLPIVAWDAPWLYKMAAEAAKSVAPKAVANELRTMTFSSSGTQLIQSYQWSATSNWLANSSLVVASMARNAAQLHLPAGQ